MTIVSVASVIFVSQCEILSLKYVLEIGMTMLFMLIIYNITGHIRNILFIYIYERYGIFSFCRSSQRSEFWSEKVWQIKVQVS